MSDEKSDTKSNLPKYAGLSGAALATVLAVAFLASGPDSKDPAAPKAVLTTDLLSPTVEPGASVTTGACYEPDKQVAGIVLTGAAVGHFSLGEIRYVKRDQALCFEVVAVNTSGEAVRLSADVRYVDGAPEQELVKPAVEVKPEEPAVEEIQGEKMSDLDSPPVKPGATVTVTVTLPKGAELTPKSLNLRDANFKIIDEKVSADGVYSVTVLNTSKDVARLAADFAYEAEVKAEAQPAEALDVEAKPLEAKPLEAKPLEAKPVK